MDVGYRHDATRIRGSEYTEKEKKKSRLQNNMDTRIFTHILHLLFEKYRLIHNYTKANVNNDKEKTNKINSKRLST